MRTSILLAGIAAGLALTPASASTVVEFKNIAGEWYNAVPVSANSNPTYANDTTTGDASVRWGTGSPRSGYDFIPHIEPSLTVDLGSPSASTTIGEFTHLNYAIGSNTSVTSVSLKFNTDVYVDGIYQERVTFIYDFNHLETPNSANPCANGLANHSGVNANGCADRVQVNFNEQSDGFQIGNYIYALDIVGFMVGEDKVTEFWTQETKSNVAYIQGRVALYETLTPGVPEPASWTMMIAGFGLLGVAVRRQRREDSSLKA